MKPLDPPARGRRARGPLGHAALAAHALVLLTLLLNAGSLLAQPPSAAGITGVVTDPGGARVPHARVVLASAAGVVASAQTDGLGAYRFDAVAPGSYELRVAADGFRSDAQSVTVRHSERVDLPVRLHVSAVAESVVVSAAQVELPLARAADSVTVMTAGDIAARQSETVADVLRSVPGLTVARNGGRGGVTSLFPRGGDSDFTLVLVDGIKANAFGGGYDFSGLTTADIDRIEVVRGPQSALFGADAMGGVVQVVTRSGGRPRGTASVEAGSLGTRLMSAGTSGSRGAFGWGGSVERVTSDGFTGRAEATGETVSNDDFRETHGAANGSWRMPGNGDLRGTMNLTSSDRGFPGPYGSNPVGAYFGVDRVSRGLTRTHQFGARWLQPLGRQVRQSASASYVDLDSDYESDYGLSASTSRRLSLRAQTDVDIASGASLSGGVEVQRERASSTFITAGAGDPVPINRLVAGGFAELRLQPTGRFSLTAGLRAERIRRDRLDQSLDPYSPRPAFGVDATTSINPRVSGAFFVPNVGGPRGWMRVHAAAATGIRAPDALEIAFTDNPALKPERSRSVEAGIDQSLVGERLVLGATAFANRYEDLIVAVGPAMKDASRYRTDNISNARSRGVEVSVAARSSHGLDVRAGYTFLSTAILAVDRLGVAPAPFRPGDPLLRRPRHQAFADLTWTYGPVVGFAHLGARGRSLDVEPSLGTYGGLFQNGGFAVLDAGATWKAAPVLDVFARVGNLLDRRYEETYGFPALGRNAMVGVRIAAGR
jgi:outer membrane cobalamin receptor